ncbi:MAG: carbamoyltransferase [Chitinophagales bacterium]|nr:carbamoyltransferase [Chitinophagales bacterium]
MKKILGISAFYHDSAAALCIDGQIIAAAQEERFSRQKHTAAFPTNAINYCLEEAGLELDELDAIVFYDKPLLKFERLLQTYYAFAPHGLLSFLKAIPVWINEKIFLKRLIYNGLREIGTFNKERFLLLFSEHHLSHATSAFFPSSFKEAAILTIDGVGEWSTATIAYGKESSIRIIKQLEFPHSVGLLYSSFTYFLGFRVNSGEYKLMGLAPYGNPDSDRTHRFIDIIKRELVDIKPDGSIWLNQQYFNYATGLRMLKDQKWEKLFGISKRKAEAELKQEHCDLAYAIQHVTEEIVYKMAVEAKRLTNAANLCMAGGVALNCVANGRIQKAGIFENIFIQPAAGDAGGALGAALAVHHGYFDEKRAYTSREDQMQGAYLGPSFSQKEIEQVNKKVKAVYKHYDDFETLASFIAEKIAEAKVIGWFQGRMEFGPRALGNRSILGDARNPEMQHIINQKIKKRESFRPFAPSVLEERCEDYFDWKTSSPYMLMVASVKENQRLPIPENYYSLSLKERLNYKRSTIHSATHVDFTARLQTVSATTNKRYYQLIKAFEAKTGCSLILNTSFNVRGEPIVCTPLDAYHCFMQTDMDYLVMEDFVYYKGDQIK